MCRSSGTALLIAPRKKSRRGRNMLMREPSMERQDRPLQALPQTGNWTKCSFRCDLKPHPLCRCVDQRGANLIFCETRIQTPCGPEVTPCWSKPLSSTHAITRARKLTLLNWRTLSTSSSEPVHGSKNGPNTVVRPRTYEGLTLPRLTASGHTRLFRSMTLAEFRSTFAANRQQLLLKRHLPGASLHHKNQ
jgi:hypothetical protein